MSTEAHHGRLRLVLASASPRRRLLLSRFPIELVVVPSGVIEVDEEDPRRHVLDNARAKAEAVARRETGLILGADTAVVLDRDVLGKAESRAAAAAMLRRLSARTHEVLTGLHVLDVASGRSCADVERTEVTFRELQPSEIDHYLDTGEYVGVAGAYAIQGQAAVFVERIEGDYANVVGLPLHRVDRLLRSFGVSLLAGASGGAE